MKAEVRYATYNNQIIIEVDTQRKYHINFTNNTSNCKLATIENAGGFLGISDEKLRKQIIDKILSSISGRNIFIHITDEKSFNWLRDNYVHYYAVKVPVGYGTGNQYHILLKNKADSRPPFKYVEASEVINKKSLTDKEVKDIVTKVFDTTQSRDKRINLISDGLKTLMTT